MKTLEDRSVLRIAGPDARTFLQGLITQDTPAPGEAPRFSALLTPQGKIAFDFFIAPDGADYLVDCARVSAPRLLQRLSMYKLRADVRIGPEPGLAVAAGGAPVVDGAFADPRLPSLGYRAFIAAERAPPADGGDYHARRIELGVPQHADDFDADEFFLLDVNYDALNAVSYRKGCFIGQETTSRMKRKSEARRRTLVATFEGFAPERGARIVAGEELLGEVLAARGDHALAAVRIDRLAAAAQPVVAGATALRLAIPAYLEAA